MGQQPCSSLTPAGTKKTSGHTGTTSFAGSVSARGGSLSGDGGLVETSGHSLNVKPAARVITSAANGTSGEWLLDPTNLTIVSNASLPSPLVGGVLAYANNSVSTISTQVIATALGGGTNVTLQAVNDITVGAAVSASATGHTLELDAGRSIILNANISLSGGTLILSAENPGANLRTPPAGAISGAGVISADAINLVLGTHGTAIGTSIAPIQIGGGKVSVTSNGANTYLQAAIGGLQLGSASLGVGSLIATSAGDLTIAAGATIASAASANAVVLSTAGNFVNNSGSGAISLSGPGRFLIYSAAPGADTFGSLDSGNTAIWTATFASLPPASVGPSGNRYIFAFQPTISVTTTNVTKTYGTDASVSVVAAYLLSGLQPGVASSFVGDTLTGTPTVTSAGSSSTANVSPGSPYAITATTGSLAVPNGYATAFHNSGTLTVNPATLTITASPQSTTYGMVLNLGTLAFTSSGLQNGESIGGVTLQSNGLSTVPSNLAAGTYSSGAYVITPSAATGGTFNASNYTISYTPGTLTVSPATLVITANDDSKTYGTLKSFSGTAFSETGLMTANGDTITAVSESSTGSPVSASVGNFDIAVSNAVGTGLSNYTISYAPGTLTVNPAVLVITANDDGKTYGTLKNFSGTAFTASGLVAANGDTMTSVSESSTGSPVSASVGGYDIVASNAVGTGLSNYTISYNTGTLTVNPAALTITADNQNKNYGTSLALGTSGFTTGTLYNADTVTGVTLASAGAPASATVGGGPYPITPSAATGSGLGNYTISYVAGLLTVSPAVLSYVADVVGIPFGSVIPTLTGAVTGFVNGETLATATSGTPAFTTTATASSAPGTYAVAGSGLTALHGDYTFDQSPSNATALTISPANNSGPPPELTSVVAPQVNSQGDGPTDPGSLLYVFAHSDAGQVIINVIVTQHTASALSISTDNGPPGTKPIASLTLDGADYVEPPTSVDRLSDGLSQYFGEGLALDDASPSWGNDALWNCAPRNTIPLSYNHARTCDQEPH